jgi:subtilisin family serine protease
MKNRALLLTIAFSLLSAFALQFDVRSQQFSSVEDEAEGIIVKLRDDAARDIEGAAVARMVLAARARDGESLGGERFYTIRLQKGVRVEDAIRQARSNPLVEYAEKDYELRLTGTPNDSFFDRQWGLFNNGQDSGKPGADISAVQTWDLTTGSGNIVVAVIDTGVDYNHPDLAPNMWANPGEIVGNGMDDDGNGFVDDFVGWNFHDRNNDPGPAGDSHGTHVSGIIGASGNNGVGVSGVAWNVKLMALKFISGRSGKTSNAIRAINYAIEQRRRGVNVRVINASWGGTNDSNSLRDAIREANEAGILFVTSAGNGGFDEVGDDTDIEPFYPSRLSAEGSGVISVAALDRTDRIAFFSNYGHETVTIGAPGVSVLSTIPGGGYGFSSGTSMSAPHVSGVAILIWSSEPDLTPAQVKNRIASTSIPIVALASKVASSARANAYNSVTNAVSAEPELAIGEVTTNKKKLTIDGLGFREGRMIVRVGGMEVSNVKYPDDFKLASNAFTRMTVKLGKSTMNTLVPKQIPVTVEVVDATSGSLVAVTHIRL